MPKFFFTADSMSGNTITLTGTAAHHLHNVLRIKPGSRVTLCCGDSFDYLCMFDKFEPAKPGTACFTIESKTQNISEPPYKITLYQSMPKQDKLELVIQKSVELGVSEIIPVITDRSISRPKDSGKTERLQKIAESAAMQSERGLIPSVRTPHTLEQAVKEKHSHSLWLIANESEKTTNLKSIAKPDTSTPVGIWIGPEGGFSPNEINYLANAGAKSFTLGPRILRTETAALVALSQILCLWEL